MPDHHFTTPRVVYLGLAYGAKENREPRSTAGARATAPRATRERVAMRRTNVRPPVTLR